MSVVCVMNIIWLKRTKKKQLIFDAMKVVVVYCCYAVYLRTGLKLVWYTERKYRRAVSFQYFFQREIEDIIYQWIGYA